MVILGSRDTTKAHTAMASIRSRVSGAHVRHVRHVQLDLADLSSLKASVDRLDLDHLDAVVHNAAAWSTSCCPVRLANNVSPAQYDGSIGVMGD